MHIRVNLATDTETTTALGNRSSEVTVFITGVNNQTMTWKVIRFTQLCRLGVAYSNCPPRCLARHNDKGMFFDGIDDPRS